MLNVRTWITVWLRRLMGQDRGVVRGWLSDTESSRMRSPRTGFVQNMSWVCLRTGFVQNMSWVCHGDMPWVCLRTGFVQNMSGGLPGRCTTCRSTSFLNTVNTTIAAHCYGHCTNYCAILQLTYLPNTNVTEILHYLANIQRNHWKSVTPAIHISMTFHDLGLIKGLSRPGNVT